MSTRSTLHSAVIFLTLGLAVGSAHAFSIDPVQKLVEWETRGNAVATRSNKQVAIEHFEIPLKRLEKSFSANLDPKLRAALIFKKNGEEHVRWLINPEDTKWYLEVEKWLRAEGLSTARHQYFKAYQTASRSYIVEDPASKIAFSAKVSTNLTGGNWRDKILPIYDAKDIRMISDLIEDVSERVQFKNLKFQPEPAMFGITKIKQAMLVRSLEDVARGEKFYLPVFSALHTGVGRSLAKINGSLDPATYWRENLAKPLGRAYAEYSAHFGMTYDSPHGQNFLIELDLNYKPTGKIIFRDFADAYLLKPFFERVGLSTFLNVFENENIHNTRSDVTIGFLHGNSPPSWIDAKEYERYNVAFFEAYESRFSELTGIPERELAAVSRSRRDMGYHSKVYSVDTPAWKKFLAHSHCYQAVEIERCTEEVLRRISLVPTPEGVQSTGRAGRCEILLRHGHRPK